MGLLIDGRWHDQWYDTKSTGGAFKRQESAFRNWITADGSSGFKAEPGRYHLYVSLACPWAHRTLIFRKLKKLEDAITVSVVEPLMLENGWELAPGADPVNGKSFLYQVYTEVKPDISGRVTVPVLWDKQKRTIVSNEFGRDHPDAEFGVRRLRRRLAGFLPGSSARGDRRDQRLCLRPGQQRRLQGRLRHRPGGL